jgi:hypothetical protein
MEQEIVDREPPVRKRIRNGLPLRELYRSICGYLLAGEGRARRQAFRILMRREI